MWETTKARNGWQHFGHDRRPVMTTERLELDPVSQPRCRSCLETDLTQLVGVWGPAEGLVSGMPDEECWRTFFNPA